MLDTPQYLNKWVEIPAAYNKRDLILYSLGIGCDELRYVYEHDPDFSAFPTYPLVLAFKGTSQDVVSFPSEAMFLQPNIPLEGIKVGLDGERSIEKLGELNPDGGPVTLKVRLVGCHKRGTGASVENEQIVVQDGKEVFRILSGAFLVGAKNFSDSGVSNSEKVVVPGRKPDKVMEMPTTENQTQLYRLSGDYNPLHISDDFAQMSGFQKPILHGLCSLGITAHAALKAFGDDDSKKFKLFKARFAKPVLPGDTLIVEMWKEGENKIVLQTKAKSTGEVVLNNAYLLLQPNSKAKL